MRACWLKWVGRDWSISADYIWLNYSDANTTMGVRLNGALGTLVFGLVLLALEGLYVLFGFGTLSVFLS